MKIVNRLSDFDSKYTSELQRKLHVKLFNIYKAFTEKDYNFFKKDFDKLIYYYSGIYKVNNTFNAFKSSAEKWLTITYFHFSEDELKALLAKAREIQANKKNTDIVNESDVWLVYALSTQPKPKVQKKIDSIKNERPVIQKETLDDLNVKDSIDLNGHIILDID